MQRIVILGSTGSVGKKALEVISWHPERYKVLALVANQNVDELFIQSKNFNPKYVALQEEKAAEQLRNRLKEASLSGIEVFSGCKMIAELACHSEAEMVVAAITGAAGLVPTLSAVKAGKRVLLANKESLVMAGVLFREAILEHKAELIPIDSEHNALFQCLQTYRIGSEAPKGIRRMILTASGGPFRTWSLPAIKKATPAEAVQHPVWRMGPKISVDSATLMNKGLEVIEAHWLFSMESSKIEVLIHPQSIVHSMLEYEDGTTLAALSNPDMAIPIAVALSWPHRLSIPVETLDLPRMGNLSFEAVDHKRFPCLQLACEALKMGGGAPAVLSAANEVVVEHFLKGKIGFMDIPNVIASVLEKLGAPPIDSLEAVLHVDSLARQEAIKSPKE